MIQQPKARVSRFPLLVVAATSAVILAAVSACSSSGSTGGAGTSTAVASSSSQSSTSAPVAAAQAATNAAVNAPNRLPITTPLNTTPPKGKTFVWLSCELPACAELATGLQKATALIGWHLKVIQYNQANASAIVPAMQQALTSKPVAVALSGLPQALWASEIPAYKAAGVAIIASYVGPVNLDSTVIGNLADGPNLTEIGDTLANWFIADSRGEGAAAVVQLSSLPSLAGVSDTVISKVKSGCPSCKTTAVDTTLQDVEGGQLDSQIVSAIRRDPSIHYVISPQATFIDGLPVALKAAGLTNVKIAGSETDAQSLQQLKAGQMNALIGDAFQLSGFQMLDIALRHLEGMTVDPYDGGFPKQLLLPTSSFTPTADYPPVDPYISQFKALWKV